MISTMLATDRMSALEVFVSRECHCVPLSKNPWRCSTGQLGHPAGQSVSVELVASACPAALADTPFRSRSASPCWASCRERSPRSGCCRGGRRLGRRNRRLGGGRGQGRAHTHRHHQCDSRDQDLAPRDGQARDGGPGEISLDSRQRSIWIKRSVSPCTSSPPHVPVSSRSSCPPGERSVR